MIGPKSMRHTGNALSLAALLLSTAASAQPGAVARYVFDPTSQSMVDQVSGGRIAPSGSFLPATSPRGPAIRLDGLSTSLTGKAVPRLTDGSEWSIAAWVKLDALPWNEVPILDQRSAAGALFFGIDASGHLVAERQAGPSGPVRLISTGRIAARAWTLATLSYRAGTLEMSLNGRPTTGSAGKPAAPTAGSEAELLIGHVRSAALPYPSNAIHPLLPVVFTLEGSLGEITVYDRTLRPTELRALMQGVAQADLGQAPAPDLPRWKGGPGPFGAFHTTLAYDPSWDGPRRVAPDSDVVVRFPQAAIQLVFWQGANYIPAWVTENGRWYSDEFMEIYGKPRCPDGEDCEPMSDKQVRYSHVEIVESTPARAIVHWRYALSEVEKDKLADANGPSDWGAWADEYWTVYPDGNAVRRQVLWTDNPQREASEFQESIIIIPAGQTPEDNINFDALSIANLKGESKSFTWLARTATGLAKPRGPDHFTGIEDPVIQWVNLKSAWKPFQIANAGPAKFEGINWEPSMSSFEWWNHWPVAQIRSSGRPALSDDRPSHTSISHIYWPIWRKDPLSISKLLLSGLTTGSASSLAPLARSWTDPAPARLSSNGAPVAYDPAQRAYVIDRWQGKGPVRILIDASAGRPLVNPAFVVGGWKGTATISVNGDDQVKAALGYVDRLEGRSLIAFLPATFTGRVEVVLTPVS